MSSNARDEEAGDEEKHDVDRARAYAVHDPQSEKIFFNRGESLTSSVCVETRLSNRLIVKPYMCMENPMSVKIALLKLPQLNQLGYLVPGELHLL